jgi:RNA polymerase sigma-70 factor (ECF subfamily)
VREKREFQALIDRYSEGVYNHAWRMLGSREDAEEATQDVFLRVHRSLKEFRGEAQVSTWIWRITVNVCINRKEALRSRCGTGDPRDAERLADTEPDPLGAYVLGEDRERLAGTIARLPDREASAIALYYIEGRDYAEIATILRIPPGSVATALHRGRERLRSMMTQRETTP